MTPLKLTINLCLGPREDGWTAISGDRFHFGRDLVGLHKNGVFQLHDSFRSSSKGYSFRFGSDADGWMPIAGDWDKDGITTIGLYRDNQWRLRNANSRGNTDIGFTFGNFNGIVYPLASYRGGEEAVEAMAALSFVPLPDLDERTMDIPTITPDPPATTELTATQSVSTTVGEATPTIQLSISATDVEATPIIDAPGTPIAVESEPSLTPTIDVPTATIEPTVTFVPQTIVPTDVPTTAPEPIPTQTPLPSMTPTSAIEVTEDIQSD